MTRSLRIAAALAVLLFAGAHLQAQDTSKQESRRDALRKEIAQLEQQIKDNTSKSNNALNQLKLVRKQVATRRYAYLRDLSGTMNTQARRLKEMRAALQEDLERLAALKAEAEEVRSSREQDLESLKAEEKRSDKVVADLQKDQKRYQKDLENKRKQVEALNREIERIIAQAIEEARRREEEAAKQNSGHKTISGSQAVDIKLSGEFAANKGKLPWPADGPVVEGFGKHNHPVYTSLVMPANNGVNIGLSADAEVKAVFDGEVKRVIVMPGYGRCILVQHGGYFTFYCKLGKVDVKSGDKVKTGQVLGRIDTIDGQTELHFEVWKEKEPENPELWLRKK